MSHSELPDDLDLLKETAHTQEPDKPKGNLTGRYGHDIYSNAELAWYALPDLKVGDPCPERLCTGKLSYFPAGIIVQMDAQPIAKVTKHIVEKLRCNLCLKIFKAPVPEALQEKQKIYTPAFMATLAMQKFYLATPYNRFESYSRAVDCPLPSSTQWDLIEKLAGSCYAPFQVLLARCANGRMTHNDDTVVRILDVMAENKKNPNLTRKGCFTTCILGADETHPIILYFNSNLHSGENVTRLLKHREPDKEKLIQMCDAAALNTPKTIETIICYCLAHGFRKLEEIADFFPESCLPIMKQLSAVFKNDKDTTEMSDEARLAYHQKHSAPILHVCHNDIERLLSDPKTEPNGELAKALNYLKKNWVPLTRFLSVSGAPIDNNVVERALKLAIRIRKGAYFYKSGYSAYLSGVLLSLIYTAIASKINPIDYLSALHTHSKHVQSKPDEWLPWHYQATLKANNLTSKIILPATVPPPPEVLASKKFATVMKIRAP